MRFLRDNLLLFTFSVMVGIATLDSKIVLAGGDPSIKDSKVKKQKSNIKQHDHNKTYKTQNKKENLKKSNTTSNSKNTKKNEESTVSGFSAVEDEPLIVDLSSVIDSDGMGQVSVQWQISDTGNNW